MATESPAGIPVVEILTAPSETAAESLKAARMFTRIRILGPPQVTTQLPGFITHGSLGHHGNILIFYHDPMPHDSSITSAMSDIKKAGLEAIIKSSEYKVSSWKEAGFHIEITGTSNKATIKIVLREMMSAEELALIDKR